MFYLGTAYEVFIKSYINSLFVYPTDFLHQKGTCYNFLPHKNDLSSENSLVIVFLHCSSGEKFFSFPLRIKKRRFFFLRFFIMRKYDNPRFSMLCRRILLKFSRQSARLHLFCSLSRSAESWKKMSDCLCVRIGQKRIAEFTAVRFTAVIKVYLQIFLFIQKKTSVFLIKAIEDFQFNNKDPKAELIGFIFGQSEQIFLVLYCFYDAPTDNNEIFNDFLAINHDGSLQTQTCSSFFKTTYFSSGKDIR